MSSYDFLDSSAMDGTKQMLKYSERVAIREEQKQSFLSQGCGYTECFYVTVPSHYPDHADRIHNLINFYFREYEYIEVIQNYNQNKTCTLSFFK